MKCMMHVDVRLSDQFSAQCFISVTQFQMYLETDALNYSFEHSMMLLLYCTLYIVDWANYTLIYTFTQVRVLLIINQECGSLYCYFGSYGYQI